MGLTCGCMMSGTSLGLHFPVVSLNERRPTPMCLLLLGVFASPYFIAFKCTVVVSDFANDFTKTVL